MFVINILLHVCRNQNLTTNVLLKSSKVKIRQTRRPRRNKSTAHRLERPKNHKSIQRFETVGTFSSAFIKKQLFPLQIFCWVKRSTMSSGIRFYFFSGILRRSAVICGGGYFRVTPTVTRVPSRNRFSALGLAPAGTS